MSADVPCHITEGQRVKTCTLKDMAHDLERPRYGKNSELGLYGRTFLASDLLLRVRVDAAGDVVSEAIVGLRIMPMRDHTASLL